MNFLRQRKFVRTLTMPDGTLVKVVEEDNRDARVFHKTHWDEHVDALVQPNPIVIPIRTKRFL